jgi:hypothetical protein
VTRFEHRSSGAIQDRPVPWRFRMGLFLLLPLTLGVQLVASAMPAVVERYYAEGAYPYIQKFVSAFSEWTSWSIAEVLIVVIALFLVWRLGRVMRGLFRKRRSVRNVLAHATSGVLAMTGVLYAWGVFGWGLNYQRLPFEESAALNTAPATGIELRLLCERLAADAGALRDGLTALGEAERGLSRIGLGFEQVWPDYPDLHGTHVTRAKPISLPALGWLGLGGVFSPYTSEPNVNAHQPIASTLASGCHEVAHQAGWAREEEASFVGFAVCRRHPDPELRYAALQDALKHCAAGLSRVDPDGWRDLRGRMHPAILEDWTAAQQYWTRHDTPIAAVTEKVNDTYLKSQGQEQGVGHYQRFLDLLVGDLRRRQAQVAVE